MNTRMCGVPCINLYMWMSGVAAMGMFPHKLSHSLNAAEQGYNISVCEVHPKSLQCISLPFGALYITASCSESSSQIII